MKKFLLITIITFGVAIIFLGYYEMPIEKLEKTTSIQVK
jgi:hypothetical protein